MSKINSVAELERDVELVVQELHRNGTEPLPQRKSSSEAIADQSIALLTSANSRINESFDDLQKKLDELRRMQREKMDNAVASVRAIAGWNDYMIGAMTQLDSGIETARGDMAKLTKS